MSANKLNGGTTTSLIYQNGESVTYLPEGAVSLELCDNYGQYHIYEIKAID